MKYQSLPKVLFNTVSKGWDEMNKKLLQEEQISIKTEEYPTSDDETSFPITFAKKERPRLGIANQVN